MVSPAGEESQHTSASSANLLTHVKAFIASESISISMIPARAPRTGARKRVGGWGVRLLERVTDVLRCASRDVSGGDLGGEHCSM